MTTEQSTELGELAKALAAAQFQMQPAKFDSVNPHFKNRFASLTSVIEAVRPLGAAGIAYVQQAVCEGELVGVRTMLVHTSGQWVASTCWSKPERPGPQAMGSVITYLRRYSLSAIVGISADEDDEDDDANTASAPKVATSIPSPKAKALTIETPPAPVPDTTPTSAGAPSAKDEPTATRAANTAAVAARFDERPTPSQVKALFAALSPLGLGGAEAAEHAEAAAIHDEAGDKDKAKASRDRASEVVRTATLGWLSWVAGRSIESSKVLTKDECSRAIDHAKRGEFPTVAA